MADTYRYKLEKGSKKHRCPACHEKLFVRFTDSATGNYIPELYGICDRAVSCAYNLNPYKDGYAKMVKDKEKGEYKGDWQARPTFNKPKPQPKAKPVFMPVEVLQRTRSGYEQNGFIQNLLGNVKFPFEVQDVENVISLYHLGTVQNGYRKGATTFPFIDIDKNVRAIQVKNFDEMNHTTGTDFLHSMIQKHHNRSGTPQPDWMQGYINNETKVSCLFGEHLLTEYPNNPIALVEAPKTAIYGTLYFGYPEQPNNMLWLAVYNLSSLNLEKCKALEGRNVYLFPDLSKEGKAFELWSSKAIKIESQLRGARFTVSDLLEQLAPDDDRTEGKDIADYLIMQDWRLFQEQPKTVIPQPIIERPKQAKSVKGVKSEALKTFLFFDKIKTNEVEQEQPENWEQAIQELETYFKIVNPYPINIKLNQGETINNVSKFITTHLAVANKYNGNITFKPYLNRLQELKMLLEQSCPND